MVDINSEVMHLDCLELFLHLGSLSLSILIPRTAMAHTHCSNHQRSTAKTSPILKLPLLTVVPTERWKLVMH